MVWTPFPHVVLSPLEVYPETTSLLAPSANQVTQVFSFLYSFREAVFAFIVCLDFMMRLKRWRVHKGVVKHIVRAVESDS